MFGCRFSEDYSSGNTVGKSSSRIKCKAAFKSLCFHKLPRIVIDPAKNAYEAKVLLQKSSIFKRAEYDVGLWTNNPVFTELLCNERDDIQFPKDNKFWLRCGWVCNEVFEDCSALRIFCCDYQYVTVKGNCSPCCGELTRGAGMAETNLNQRVGECTG